MLYQDLLYEVKSSPHLLWEEWIIEEEEWMQGEQFENDDIVKAGFMST